MSDIEKRLDALADERSQPAVIGDELMDAVRNELERLRWDIWDFLHSSYAPEWVKAAAMRATELDTRARILRAAAQLGAEAYMFELRTRAVAARRELKSVRSFAQSYDEWREDRYKRIRKETAAGGGSSDRS
jgi:hypothetical protein